MKLVRDRVRISYFLLDSEKSSAFRTAGEIIYFFLQIIYFFLIYIFSYFDTNFILHIAPHDHMVPLIFDAFL